MIKINIFILKIIPPKGEMLMLFDYHLHSQFSADSEMTMEQLCQAAVEKGLDEIAITDHHDIDYQDNTIEFLIDRNQYLQEITNFQKKYKDKLKIKKGIEMGLQPHILQKCQQYTDDHFDFIIGSFHTAEKKDLYNGDFFEGYSQWEAYIQYLKTVNAGDSQIALKPLLWVVLFL